MHAYNGKLLLVDLESRVTKTVPLAPDLLERFLGGVGLGVRLLFEYCPAGADPLSPENPLIFTSSAFAGTMVPAAGKHAVVAKSPLTGFVGDSLSSSFWSLALKRSGYDAIVITGACAALSYLFVDDEVVHIRPALHLAGLDCSATEESIRARSAMIACG